MTECKLELFDDVSVLLYGRSRKQCIRMYIYDTESVFSVKYQLIASWQSRTV
jgi:hypothetical protein